MYLNSKFQLFPTLQSSVVMTMDLSSEFQNINPFGTKIRMKNSNARLRPFIHLGVVHLLCLPPRLLYLFLSDTQALQSCSFGNLNSNVCVLALDMNFYFENVVLGDQIRYIVKSLDFDQSCWRQNWIWCLSITSLMNSEISNIVVFLCLSF